MPPDPQPQPPVITAPPLLPPELATKPGPLRQALAVLLSLCLGLFLADAVVSVADDSLALFWGTHFLTWFRAAVSLLALLAALLVYGLMALTPMIPKRLFLPVTLFNPAAMLALIPLAIYFHDRFDRLAWLGSLCQVVVGLAILWWAQGGLRLRWPLVPGERLGSRRFSWRNLSAFLLVNAFLLLPAVIVYLAVCAAVAVGHFSDGFLALRPDGFAVRVRTYARADGKTIQLVPMAHIGERDFYRKLSQSFPPNAVVLMEGVSDTSNLLTNKVTYKRMASSLGLAEQQKEFQPVQVEMVPADVDVEEFTPETIAFLNLAMLIHANGLSAGNVRKLLRYSPSPQFEEQLIEDLLRKRNQHLLAELRARLSDPEPIIVPWGAAHMPGIAKGVRASGFHLAETREYTVIRFRFAGQAGQGRPKAPKAVGRK